MSMASKIDEFIDLVGNVEALLQKLAALPITGWILLIVLLLLIWLNKNFSWLYEVAERRGKQRLELLDRYVSAPEPAAKNAIEAVRTIRDAGYFKIATGIDAEGHLLDGLIKLHEMTSHHIDWRQIRLAMPFLVPATVGVSVRKLNRVETIGRLYNRATGFALTVLAAALASVSIVSVVESPERAFIGLGGAILVMLFAIFVFSQNSGFDAAERIAKELEELRKQQSEPKQ